MIKRILIVILSTIFLLVLSLVSNFFQSYQVESYVENNSCSIVNVPKSNIPNYKPKQVYEYTKSYSSDELYFQENEISPKINNNSNFLDLYLNAIKCKDKSLVKMLSAEEFPTIKSAQFDLHFNNFWQEVAGKKAELILLKKDNSNLNYIIKFEDKFYNIRLYDYGDSELKILKTNIPFEEINWIQNFLPRITSS